MQSKSVICSYDCRGIKLPRPSGSHEPGYGGQGGCSGCGGQNGARHGSAKDRDISDLNKQLSEQSSRSINDVNTRKDDDIEVSTDFSQDNKKISSDRLLLCLTATTIQRALLLQVATAPVTCSPHLETVPYPPPPIRSDQTMCLRITKIDFIIF